MAEKSGKGGGKSSGGGKTTSADTGFRTGDYGSKKGGNVRGNQKKGGSSKK